MRELMKSSDPVLISAVEARLRAERIEPIKLDTYVKTALGGLGFVPVRIMVEEEDFPAAREIWENIKLDARIETE